LALFFTPLLLAARLSRPRTSKKFISEFFDVLTGLCNLIFTLFRRIRDNQYEFPPHRDVSLDARELVQQILTPNPQERPTLRSIIDHAFFTRGIVPGFMPVTARDAPPDFRHISPLVSQANLARLRQTCHLDGEVVPDTSRNTEPPAPSASSATSSLAQQEREFLKAVQPGSPISALLSSARQPLMVAPAGGATIRGEPTLLRKLQAAKKEAARSPAHVNKVGGRLQEIAEEGGLGDGLERREEEVRMKELQSQKARIVAQMVPAQASRAPGSPFEDTENVPVSAPEPAQGERRVRLRTREALPVVGEAAAHMSLSKWRTKAECYFIRVLLQQCHKSNIRAAQSERI
jgi:hypothetical protein